MQTASRSVGRCRLRGARLALEADRTPRPVDCLWTIRRDVRRRAEMPCTRAGAIDGGADGSG